MTRGYENAGGAPRARLRALLVLMTLLGVHSLCLANGFVDFDDDTIFLKNPHFALPWSEFLTWSFDLDRPDTWRPIRDLSHFVDLKVHGQAPLWAHAHNLLLLMITAALAMAVFQAVGIPSVLTMSTVLIAFIHPVQVEAITWVSGRKDLLAGVLFFATILAFIRFCRGRHSLGWGVLVVVLSAVGVMAKGHLVVMPLILYWIYLLLQRDTESIQAGRPSAVYSLIGILAAGAVYIAPRIAAGGVSLPLELQRDPNQSIMLSDKLQLPLRYLSQLVWPIDLNHIYFTPRLDQWHTLAALTSVILIVSIIWVLTKWISQGDKRGPLLAVGCTLMLPYLHLRTGVVYMADRYLFVALPFIAMVLALTLIKTSWWSRVSTHGKRASLVLLVTLLAIGCIPPHSAFHDSVSLWTRMTDVYPESAWGYDRLGRALYSRGQYRESAGAWLRAVECEPTVMKHLNNAAVAAMALGRNKMALELLLRVQEVEPHNQLALRNLEIIRRSISHSLTPSE